MTEDERRALWAAALGVSPDELPDERNTTNPEPPRPLPQLRRRPS